MINETITIDAGPAIGELGALASAAEEAAAKIDAAFKGIKVPSLGGSGAANMARSMDAAAEKMSAAVDKMEESFAKLKAVGAEAGAAMGDIGKAGAESAAGLGDAAKGANDAAESYARLGKAARDSSAMLDEQAVAGGRASKSSAEAAAGGTKFWGGLKTVMIGTGIAAAYGIDKAMKFQSQMLLLHTQAGVSTADVKQMSQGALQISTQTGQSLSDVAESAYHVASNMASMGTTVPKMLLATKTAAEGAAVGHANMVDVTNALTAAIASGIPGVKNYSQAMGMLNATVGSGDMSMQDLSEAFGTGMVASVKGYGLSLKDVGAGLAVFGDNNIRGAKAGTDMRMAVQSLAVPAASAKAELAGLGLTQNSLANDMKSGGLMKALDDLNTKFKEHGVTAKDEGQVITDLFGKKAGVGLSLLMGQMDRLQSKYPAITDGADKFNKAWEATQQSPAQKWKELTAGLQASATGFGTALLPAFTKVTGFADKLLTDINGSKDGATALAVTFGGVAALFAGKKLLGGIESSAGTLGKIGSFLNIPGLKNLGQAGGADAAATANGRLAASADAAAAALGRVAGAGDEAAVGETAAGKGGGLGSVAAGSTSKIGSAVGAALMTAAGAWIIGHVTDMFLKPPTKDQQQTYKQQVPGYVQAPANFVFGKKAPTLYADVPDVAAASGHNWEHWFDDVLGRKPQPAPVYPAEPSLTYPSGKPFYGEVPRGLPTPKNFRADIPSGLPAPIPAYADGQPFYGEVPHGLAKPAAAPAASSAAPMLGLGGKPAVLPAPDLSAVTAAKSKIQSDLGNINVKPLKMPAPDTSAFDSAKGKITAAAQGITQAADSALKKPVKASPPDISAYRSAIGPARTDGAQISAGLAGGILAGEGAVVAAASQVASAAAAAMSHAIQSHSPSKVTEKTGKDFDAGFVVGLQGGQSAINDAATAIGKSAAKAADIASIDSYTTKLLAQVPKGDTGLTAMLKADNADLDRMAGARQKLETEISDSEQVAKSVIGNASITNALNAVSPAGNEPVASTAVVQGQQYQASTLKQFAASLKQLQGMGLNATALSQLAQGDPSTELPIAQGIASGGKSAVRQLNMLQKQMQSSAASIGNVAGPAMYQAGQDAGAGLAEGLKASLGSLDKAMDKLAASMVASVSKVAKTTKAAASSAAGTATASTTAAGGTAASAASGSAASKAAAVNAASLVAAGASLSHAGSSLTSSASALTGAASALMKAAPGGQPGTARPGGGYGGTGGTGYLPSFGSGGGGTHYHQHVTVNVQGSVMAQNDLMDTVQTGLVTRGINNWQTGIIPPGRAG